MGDFEMTSLSQIHRSLSDELATLFVNIDEVSARPELTVGGLSVVCPNWSFLAFVVDSDLLCELQGLTIGLKGIFIARALADDGPRRVGNAHIESLGARLNQVVGCHGEVNPDTLGTVGTVGPLKRTACAE